ncbi:MAG: flavodoxin family protein [Bacteroidales bacterium]|nr:flavodoxin family protein [Bacteroidales bacterium]
MSKKILVISSSPRRKSNSDAMCDEFIKGTKENNSIVEKIRLSDYLINYCTGCDLCSTYNKPCNQKDDAKFIIEKMINADVIVMATPLYFYAMSAQLKTLIDRCCGEYTKMQNKDFYFIVTAAENSEKQAYRAVENITGFLDCLENPSIKGVCYGLGVWHTGEIKDNKGLIDAYNMGKNII